MPFLPAWVNRPSGLRSRATRTEFTCLPGTNSNSCIVVLNPGSSQLLPLRQWPEQHYGELARTLLRDHDLFVVLIGLADDVALGNRIARAVGSSRCVNLCGKTSFDELMALLHMARLLISHDSGPCCFAALCRTNTVALFGPETPLLYAPLLPNLTILYKGFACSPCVTAFNHRRSPCTDNLCLQAISVEEVIGEVRKYLVE